MNKIFRSLSRFMLTASLASAALCSCSVASAATLPHSFTASDGTTSNLAQVATIEKVSGSINALGVDGVTRSYADATGAVWTKVTGSAYFAARFVSETASLYVNTETMLYATCDGGATYLFYAGPVAMLGYGDNCKLANAIKAASN